MSRWPTTEQKASLSPGKRTCCPMIEVDTDNDVPMCDSCGHRHVQGVRCTVCGHVGKSQIFTKMRAKASERRITRVGVVNGADIDGTGISSHSYSLFQVLLRLRKRTLEQRGIQLDEDNEMIADKSSSHLVCFVGDSPVAISRWSIQQFAQNEYCLLVDKVLVLSDCGHRRIAYRCLYYVLYAAQRQKVPLQHIDIHVPMLQDSHWVVQKLQSFGFVAVEQLPNNWFGMNSVNMRLVLRNRYQSTSAPTIEDLLGFLLQKISS